MMVDEATRRRVADDPVLRALPRMAACAFVLRLGGEAVLVSTGDGVTVRSGVDINDRWDFELALTGDAWDRYRMPVPPPGYNTAQALVAHLGADIVGGDRLGWAQHAPVVDRVLQVLAGKDDLPAPSGARLPEQSRITGRYVPVSIGGVTYRVYYETAGAGIPLLCLHTAGSDSRQYHHLMEDADLTDGFAVYAFDLPWHGRTNPPPDWRSRTYRLEIGWYADAVLAFAAALGLSAPALLGCSMGGSLGLYLASRHGDAFRAVVSLEGGFGNPARRVDWTRHMSVDHSLFLSTWVAGLMSPTSPRHLQDQVLWEYGQSGAGVYNGDTAFVADLPDVAATLGPATCPLYVFCGEYDYSSTPEMSRTAAERLGGRFTLLEGMGHFPMTEDPERFRAYLAPVLDEIRSADTGG
ncbi:MAG: alpha/beta fold hydrolase [Streptosporangiales bacterium]|nr:alpha/beta fold hydrolase [Streptosporangiales bacterium]